MSTGKEKLERDLDIVEAMVSEMEDYLMSDVLFWPMMKGGLPRLTLGGYLTRQHRLMALHHLLDGADLARLDSAVFEFNQTVAEKIVRLEQKAHEELEARLRQWSEYLKDLDQDAGASVVNYNTAVEARAMISAIIDKLAIAPYKLDPRITQQLELLDRKLRGHWKEGDFIWPQAWQPAYPKAEYWWLYGKPR